MLGGGRYDNLLKQLGDKDIPAVGFAAGVERMMMLLEEYPSNSPDVYVAWLGDEVKDFGIKITKVLRDAGIKTFVDFNSKGMKSHMKKADKLGVKYCIIAGEDEINKGTVLLKDFTNRTQEELSFEKAMEIIKESR